MLVELSNGLSKTGVQVDLIVISSSGPLARDLDHRVKLVIFGCNSYKQALVSLASYYAHAKPTIVLSSLYATGLVAIAAKYFQSHKPLVVVGAHNSLKSKCEYPDNWKDKVFLLPLCRWLFPKASGLIAVSDGVAHELIDLCRLRPSQVRTIYNPIINDRFISRSEEPVCHPWFLDHARRFRLIVSVGRLVEQKGYDVLLRAFCELRNSVDSRLVLIGAGPLEGALRGLAVDLGISAWVDFLGLQENPYKYVRQADIFVLASRWEGLPTVLIEALACGVKVVATDCRFGPSEILDGGKFGALAQVDDYIDLAKKMFVTLSSDDRESKEARITRSQDFSVSKVTGLYLSYFNSLLNDAY